ncbi:hypothetical protein GQX73_g5860 [Xylaria multiplex]|uniref:DUF4470 domain-containing protein n=1 Tax=Xylaria multiplex TaxID=323545 RepID=A0A7C8MT53_9PEZI|nr:hypothetical protein GQX73_g5860 [Xylaria multiplex]
MKRTWKPRWVVENRTPTFISPRPGHVKFGAVKYLWGNVPAIDVIQLGQNEGAEFQTPINLLFAASGDLRNIVLSVTSLPQSYRSPLSIVINDCDIDIVARNLIFLLIMFIEKDSNTAAEFMLHVWYSALVTEACYTLLQKKLKPLIEDVCNKIAGKPSRTLLGKTWHFGGSSLRLVLTREAWIRLPSYFNVPNGMTKKKAHAVRQAVVNPPLAGLGMIKYRNCGVLLPFGQPCEAFVIPNPTVFNSCDEWPMMDSADPSDGWSIKTFLATKAGPAKKDMYGQLHHYLKRLFTKFHCYLHSKPVSFELQHVYAQVLEETLAGKKFDRIEISNICDSNYLGIDITLRTLGPLLRSPSANRHATLITTFLNAVPEARMVFRMTEPFAAGLITKYMDRYDFAHAASSAGLKMKEEHTIIPAWPLRVNDSLHPAQKDREDFKLLLGTAHIGHERYMEWKVGAVRVAADTQLGGSCILS